MRASLTVAGVEYPLNQVTLRRQQGNAELSAQIVGHHNLALAAAVVLSVEGFADIVGVLTESDPGLRGTRIVASVPVVAGTGEYRPAGIQYRTGDLVRGDLDFDVRPGDTLNGADIVRVTSTMGAGSPWFTEVGF